MKPQAGPPVTGDNFFNRDAELRLLDAKVRGGTHILLAGQRRMGKTSLARELGRRLQADAWAFLFVDVEDAASPSDIIRDIAKAAHAVTGASSRLTAALGRWFKENVEELSALEFGVKLRTAGDYAWRQQGDALMQACADHEPGVLLVLDELPIFLSRLLARQSQEGTEEARLFLRWLRGLRQQHADSSLVQMVSGSIGMATLVERMGVPDSINDLYSFRLGPWNRAHSVACLKTLHSEVPADEAVFDAIHDALGVGIPHFIQSFFARLQDFAVMNGRTRLTVKDVQAVYESEMLGPAGHGDLLHYEKRLQASLDERTYQVAMEIQAEAATQGIFSVGARRALERIYSSVLANVRGRVDEALDVLVHDGHLERTDAGHRLAFRLLEDWLRTRFSDHHVPLQQRIGGQH